MMKTLHLLIVVVMLNLATGCATCHESSSAYLSPSTGKTPAWQQFFGWLFDCVTYNAMEYGTYQQRIQSGDPTR